ncbi:hypothetical protein EYF80_061521 [Liparis tanakae]|uniref:Secreted protein n=1 Tax=Liparis tanakae TaxID=230148 RepID=A0A4Z2EI90_9TELE|nr:hypothetical protein EYF80_061521 [Liparis tanakae]
MSGLLWLLVVFDGQESESDSLVRMTETTTSFSPPGGFSWGDTISSDGTKRGTCETQWWWRNGGDVKLNASGQTGETAVP